MRKAVFMGLCVFGLVFLLFRTGLDAFYRGWDSMMEETFLTDALEKSTVPGRAFTVLAIPFAALIAYQAWVLWKRRAPAHQRPKRRKWNRIP